MTLQFLTLRAPAASTAITWKHIVDDYGATPGGSGTASGDYTAFKAFRDWAIEQTGWVGLTLPPSSGAAYYGCNGSYAAAGPGNWPPAISNTPFFGIPKLVVNGYSDEYDDAGNRLPGARITGLFGSALANNNSGRSLIHTVNPGATVLTLITEADAAKYTVGGMILLAGLDLQGFGYPPNPQFFEWHRIVDITGANITVEEPIRYRYSEDWPTWFEGHPVFELGTIGAASIVRTIPAWDCEHRLYGLESLDEGQTYYFVRKATLVDCKQTGNGFIPGASEDHRIINQYHSTSGMEVDKLTSKAVISGYGPANRSIGVQSASVDELIIRDCTRTIQGTAKRTLIDGGSSPAIWLGPVSYGVSETIVVRNHVTGGFTGPNIPEVLGTSVEYVGDGVFRWLGSSPPQWLVPGGVGIIETVTPFYHHHVFNVLDQRKVGDDIFIDTDIVGADLPEVTGFANQRLRRQHAPDLTVENCTGSDEAVELSMAGANQPYGTFRRRTYTGSTFQINGTSSGYLVGRLVHMKINVVQAYTGVASVLTFKLGQFGIGVIAADKSVTGGHVRVNCKIAGERVITPDGVTGAQTGDVDLSALTGGVWMPGSFGAFFGAGTNGSTAVNISGEADGVRPIVTIEALTDQEF